MKTIARIFRSVLVLIAAALFFAATQDANAQTTGEQKVTIVVQPAQSVEERVADSIKERELLKAAEEKKAAEESARLARTNPKALLASARTMHIYSGTSFFESVQLQNALRKRTEFEAWQLMILDGTTWDRRNVADLLIEVDRPLFTYTFTYQLTHPSTGIVLATGKVTAFDGNAAAPKLAKKIVEEIKKARGEATEKK
jgi:basic membrane lipoprotein Med (substrate-binding protein (PBP1-ABC) superfamily)